MMIPKQKHLRQSRDQARRRSQLADHYHALRSCLNGGAGALAMIELVHCYAIDGDVMACQGCAARLHVGRWREPFQHGPDEVGQPCALTATDNPWPMLFRALDQIRGLGVRQATQDRALRAAAGRFREYEALHAAKPDPLKAKRNRDMAELCEAALADGGGV